MEVERIQNGSRIELWAYEWDTTSTPKIKTNRRFVGYEQPVKPEHAAAQQTKEAICWSYGRTLGNIAVFSEEVLGKFPGKKGDDAILACDIVEAGKFRHGAKRWWCRTHQRHWGTKGDVAAALQLGGARCSNNQQPMSYVIDPPHIRLEDHAEVGICGALYHPQ